MSQLGLMKAKKPKDFTFVVVIHGGVVRMEKKSTLIGLVFDANNGDKCQCSLDGPSKRVFNSILGKVLVLSRPWDTTVQHISSLD